MEFDLSAIFRLLTQAPGNLIYHLVSGLTLLVLMVFAIANLRRDENPELARHILIGCTILLVIQFLTFITIDIAENVKFLETALSAAVFERITAALLITWLIWTILEEKISFLFTGSAIFLTLAIIIGGMISIIIAGITEEPSVWSESTILILWEVGTVFLILTGITLLIITKPDLHILGAFLLLMLGLGYIVKWFQPENADLSLGSVRLAQTLALPWILTHVKRFRENVTQPRVESPLPVNTSDERIDLTPALVKQLLEINLQENPEKRYEAIAQALSLTVVSDVCYLVKLRHKESKIDLVTGYDLIREVYLKPTTLLREELLNIMDAWEENRPFQLSSPGTNTPDALTLTLLLHYHYLGNLLAYPLSLPGQPVSGGIIFLSPYTGKGWDEKTLQILETIRVPLAEVLLTRSPQEKLQAELEQIQRTTQILTEENENLSYTVDRIEADLKDKETSLQQLRAKYQIEKLDAVKQIEDFQEKIDTLEVELSEKTDKISDLEQMKTEIRQLRDERDRLKIDLTRAEAKISSLEVETGQTGPIRLSTQNQVLSLDSIAATLQLGKMSALQEKNLELDIINPDGRQLIKTDPDLLRRILHGLIENAITASIAGKSIELDLRLSLETGMLVIQVTDNGEGLTQQEQQALFSAEAESIPGIGSIPAIREAIRAIRLLNGKIWLRSKKGSFTTFRVQLPVRIID